MLFQLLFGLGRVMAYTVHEQPLPPIDRMDRAEALRFVKDGFSLQAAVAGPVWLGVHQLWRAVGAYVALLAAIAIAYTWFGLPDFAALVAIVAMHLLIGFEGDSIERADLERQGWSSLGSVTGASALECQRRFFDQWLLQQPVLAPPPVVPSSQRTPAPAPSPRSEQSSNSRGGTAAAWFAALWGSKR